MPLDALRDILEEVLEIEKRMNRNAPGFKITADIGQGMRFVPIHDDDFKGTGDAVLGQLLGHLPEAKIWPDPSGLIMVTGKATTAEKFTLQQVGHEFAGGGHVVKPDRKNIRAEAVHVYFPILTEFRFDFEELELRSSTTAVTDEDAAVDNVMQVPDFSVTLADGRKVPQGTWVTIVEYLNAIASEAPPGLNELDLPNIRRLLVPFKSLHAALLQGSAGSSLT